MPKFIEMPKLSDTMTEGTLAKWLIKEGDTLKTGQVVAVDRGRFTVLIDNDAGRRLVTCTKARQLGRKGVIVGDEVRVGDVLLRVMVMKGRRVVQLRVSGENS